ncbi:hypothetical protein [Streptomyces phytophilus]|uniref:hypothetical protein n=1 Tax=Streptomyces phytophilus TaxID=722715 RepID=UPI0015F0C415|nr:hypothetical protein [Streptomyces phytophilus]
MSLIDDFTPASAIESRAPLADRAQYALTRLDTIARRIWGDETTWTPIQRLAYDEAHEEIYAMYEQDSAAEEVA